jgi:hypothetical protein
MATGARRLNVATGAAIACRLRGWSWGMSKILFLVVALVALLVATNPSRGEYNEWVEQFAIGKLERDAAARKEQVSWTERVFGGASAGLIVRNIPVARRNFVIFSVYRLDLPEGFGEAEGFPECVIGIAGQFIRANVCALRSTNRTPKNTNQLSLRFSPR